MRSAVALADISETATGRNEKPWGRTRCRNGSWTSRACSGACGRSSTIAPRATARIRSAASIGTSPRGVAHASAAGTAAPCTGTRCTGPNATTLRIESACGRSRAYAVAATGPE